MKTLLLTALSIAIGSTHAQTQSAENAQNHTERSAAITANFTANKTTICVGETVQFTDNSTGSPNTWTWQFAGGSPSSSTVQNPAIQYNAPGTYNVVLNASNGSDQNTLGKLSYIRVEACTGLGTNPNEFGIEVFPVPATNFLYIQSKNEAVFTINNLSGQVMQSGRLKEKQTMEISLEKLAPGFYYLKSETATAVLFTKFVVE